MRKERTAPKTLIAKSGGFVRYGVFGSAVTASNVHERSPFTTVTIGTILNCFTRFAHLIADSSDTQQS